MQANPETGAAMSVDEAASKISGLLDDKGDLNFNQEEKKETVETKEVKNENEVKQETEAKDEPVKSDESKDKESTSDETESKEAKTDEGETPKFNTIDEIAEALGMPVDDFLGSIKGKIKLDGKENEVTLAELRNGYQRDADYRQKTMALAESRKAFEAEQAQYQQAVNQRLQEAETLSAVLEAQFTKDFENVNWAELRSNDPSEYAAKRQDYIERQQQIAGYRNYARSQLEAVRQESEAKLRESQANLIKQERERYFDKHPEFKDPSKWNSERKAVKDYLASQGFTESDIAGLVDHRALDLIRKARLYDESIAKSDAAKKRVVNIPKLVKPGTKPSKEDAQADRNKALRDRLRKSGRIEDAAALIMQKL